LALAVSVLFSGCNGKQNPKQDVVIWDVEHKPVFSPDAFSTFISTLESSGLVVIQGGTGDISAAGGYIIAGPTKRFEEDEVKQIEEFVRKGGKLVIMVHIPPSNLKPLLDTFDIEVSQEPLKEKDVMASPMASPVSSHVLTEGVNKIMLYGCFRVSNAIFTANEENKRNDGNIGVVGYVLYGDGEVMVIGDDALFINEYINSYDNLDFAQNVAEWLGLRSV
jgi:hypothetical protein